MIDADKALAIDNKWIKGIVRKGDVLYALRRYGEAHDVFSEGVALAPFNESLYEKAVMAKRAEEIGGASDTSLRKDFRSLDAVEKGILVLRAAAIVFFTLFLLSVGQSLPSTLYALCLLSTMTIYAAYLFKVHGQPVPTMDYLQRIRSDWNAT